MTELLPRVRQRRFFGVPLAAGSTCTLETEGLGLGVMLTLTQATLAGPLPSASAELQLFCNGAFLCRLSRRTPNANIPLTRVKSPELECVGPAGTAVHLAGFTHALKRRRPADAEEEEEEMEGGPTEAEYRRHLEIQRSRKRRLEELQQEAAAEAATPSKATPMRKRRLSFNQDVVAAVYSPKECGIFPGEAVLSLDKMVALREEIKRVARESTTDDGEEDEDEEALQQVLSVLLQQHVTKLRIICKTNGLHEQGAKTALIGRLIDHIAADMREERAAKSQKRS